MLTWTTSVYKDTSVKAGTLLRCNYYQHQVEVKKDTELEAAIMEGFPGLESRSFFVEDVDFSENIIEITLGS